MTGASLLRVRDLGVSFATRRGTARVLRGVDIDLAEGERVAVVGESGSGKSVLARAVMGLLPEQTASVTGSIALNGRNLLEERSGALRRLRGRQLAMILQDPTSSLNPTFSIDDQFRAVLNRRLERPGRAQAYDLMRKALEEVMIPDGERVLASYPFQLSGGMNQRIMIAMALINRPRLLIADEPGASLDVTVQAQTLKLMLELSDKYGTAILFISHNLGVVRGFADRVCVLYAGAVMEEASARDLFARPEHPYTRSLIEAIPRLATSEMPTGVAGHLPDVHRPPPGCVFAPRCPSAIAACDSYDRTPATPAPGRRTYCLRKAAANA